MSRCNISKGSEFEALIGYSRAVVVGDFVFVSGTTGYDYATGHISDDIVEQTEQTFKNIEDALASAGSSIKDVKWLGNVRPAATMIQANLMEDVMKIEIEVTAAKGTALASSSVVP
ncbi:RutC family protein [Ceratocystis lukuohia]|uniref:RutC family protein n=1 Tax=Ceratocystis lukuohia TaxID=2019550 RepID=A0ABR4MN60_9PEZI